MNPGAPRVASLPLSVETAGEAGDRSHDDLMLVNGSELFDAAWYRASAGLTPSDDAAGHYLGEGWRRGLEPGPNFEGSFLRPYFQSVGLDGPPMITYVQLQAMGWVVYPTRAAADEVASVVRTSNLFDAEGYAARAGCPPHLDAALHYVTVGEQMGFAPSGHFDPVYYNERNSDVGEAGFNGLVHYIRMGSREDRRPVSVASTLACDVSRFDAHLETVLLICHQATRTGAPILAYNIATRLRGRYNVVALLLEGGDLVGDFERCTAAVLAPLTHSWHPADATRIVAWLLASFSIRYVITNSVDKMEPFVRALTAAFVPVVTLVNEFPSSVTPRIAMGEVLDWATQLVFSARLTADAAIHEYPTLANRAIHVFPQGQCDIPGARESTPARAGDLARKFRPEGFENALVVLGCGTVIIRKGVDVFLSCAAAVAALGPGRPVRFIWIGRGYDPERDAEYSPYLAEQMARSRLGATVALLPEITDLDEAYDLADVLFISSRLDPLPNVGIDAAMRGIPVVCFEGATGMAEILGRNAETRRCVAPYLDVHAAARVIAAMADDDELRRTIGEAARHLARTVFDMDDYVGRVDRLGRESATIMEQRRRDFRTIAADPRFDEAFFCLPDFPLVAREAAIAQFLVCWAAVGTSRRAARKRHFRRPYPGFHPQIYAHEHADAVDSRSVNPLASYIRSGFPDGPWRHDVIRPRAQDAGRAAGLRIALHGHFYYPEFADDFVWKLAANRSRCDLLLSTDDEAKAARLRRSTASYQAGTVTIRVVPNRGRDIGAFLTAYADVIDERYDVVGHVHGKQSLVAGGGDTRMGDLWREFLWQNLLGDLYPMTDIILARFAADDALGLVFPDDPHMPDWDGNLELSSRLALRMGLTGPLPRFFDFPVGTMFWARPRALAPLFGLKLEWQDYPEEPLPVDGTILHALERLLPFAAVHTGFRYATTHVPGVTW